MDNIIEFRASHIDLWRKYMQNEISIYDMDNSLKYNSASNIKMHLGTMFHSYIEDKSKQVEVFSPSCVKYARNMFFEGIFEIKYRKLFKTKYGNVSISGTADNIYGNIINEFKTTWGSFNVERYLNSLQWQLYLQIFSVPVMKYHVFEFPSTKRSWNSLEDIDEQLEYKELHQFNVYDSMINHDLVNNCISGLTEYCLKNNIRPILTNTI